MEQIMLLWIQTGGPRGRYWVRSLRCAPRGLRTRSLSSASRRPTSCEEGRALPQGRRHGDTQVDGQVVAARGGLQGRF